MRDTKFFMLQDGALSSAPEVYAQFWGRDMRPFVIADGNTWAVAGASLERAFLGARGAPPEHHIFPSKPEVYADDRTIREVRALLEGNDRIAIALGSGTINDVVKRASYECGKQYMIVPTAPSVDGYTSFGAAISVKGFKQTLACPAPLAVVADSEILRNAPYDMIAAGYCDLAAKIPAGADWIIADALGQHPIDREVWSMVQTDLKAQIGRPDLVAARDPRAVDQIMRGLVTTGFAMQDMHDSRPASGAEHLFSHAWEMSQTAQGIHAVSHGFKVAIGSLISTAMMTEALAMDRSTLEWAMEAHPGIGWPEREGQIREIHAGSSNLDAILSVSRQKFLYGETLRARRRLIAETWDTVAKKMREQILPFEELKDMFAQARCPTEPRDIGLTRAMVREGIYTAQMIRIRYTILDYLYEIGIFDDTAKVILDSSRYFNAFEHVS
jgi:glycerol-1-phosphate dehydrogenase [NAD(P)+]